MSTCRVAGARLRWEVSARPPFRFPVHPDQSNHPARPTACHCDSPPCHRRRRRCSSGGEETTPRRFPRPAADVAVLGVGSWYLLAGRFMATPNATSPANGPLGVRQRPSDRLGEDFSETVPVGQVIRTDPASGDRVLRGGTTASIGSERYAVRLAGRGGRSLVPQEAHLASAPSRSVRDRDHRRVATDRGRKDGQARHRGRPDVRGPRSRSSVTWKPFTKPRPTTRRPVWWSCVPATSSAAKSRPATISSDPRSGSLAKGETITFTVSRARR